MDASSSDTSTSEAHGSDDVSSTEGKEAETSTASVSMVLIGAIAAAAVCLCASAAGYVYAKKYRKRNAAFQGAGSAGSAYMAVSQDSPRPQVQGPRQTMLLMNPMFASSGKKQSIFGMKNNTRASFLSNPLFASPQGEVSSSLLESQSNSSSDDDLASQDMTGPIAGSPTYDNPLFASATKGVTSVTEADLEERIVELEMQFEESFAQMEDIAVHQSVAVELGQAKQTWQEVSELLRTKSASVVSADITEVTQINGEKLSELKQSLNKIEQGALLSAQISATQKSDFCKIINQARSQLRHVETLTSKKLSVSDGGKVTPEWADIRTKLRSIQAFKIKTNPLHEG